MRTLWQHCHVATMADGRYSAIEDAAIVTSAGLIEWIGPRAELAPVEADRTVDLGGAWVTPGLIDCHTHAVFGGNRLQRVVPVRWVTRTAAAVLVVLAVLTAIDAIRG